MDKHWYTILRIIIKLTAAEPKTLIKKLEMTELNCYFKVNACQKTLNDYKYSKYRLLFRIIVP